MNVRTLLKSGEEEGDEEQKKPLQTFSTMAFDPKENRSR